MQQLRLNGNEKHEDGVLDFIRSQDSKPAVGWTKFNFVHALPSYKGNKTKIGESAISKIFSRFSGLFARKKNVS